MTETPAHPWENFTAPEPPKPPQYDHLDGSRRCHPGEPEDPSDWCRWHHTHTWCPTCLGYYGVPHDGIHSKDGTHEPHPWSLTPSACACRVCRVYVATIEARVAEATR